MQNCSLHPYCFCSLLEVISMCIVPQRCCNSVQKVKSWNKNRIGSLLTLASCSCAIQWSSCCWSWSPMIWQCLESRHYCYHPKYPQQMVSNFVIYVIFVGVPGPSNAPCLGSVATNRCQRFVYNICQLVGHVTWGYTETVVPQPLTRWCDRFQHDELEFWWHAEIINHMINDLWAWYGEG